jgi:peptidoglycan/LPS O-acetylase OafA/YrhL
LSKTCLMNEKLASRLARRTTGGRWIREIDGLRFVAITLVLLSHVVTTLALAARRSVVVGPPFGDTLRPDGFGPLDRFVRQGSIGVHVFFMISGFVLGLPFITHRYANGGRVDLRRYFRRRLTRLEPPYLIVIAALFIGSWLFGQHVGIGHLVASATYMHGPLLHSLSPLDGVAWSLEVEVQFYVLVPALALVLCTGQRRMRRETILFLVVAVIAFQVLGLITTKHAFAFLGSFLQFFLLGWLLADIYVVDWRGDPATRKRWDLLSVVLIPLLLVGLATVPLFEQAVAPWLVFGIGYCAFRGTTTRRLLSTTWVAIVGGMCYSIYLIHYPMFILLHGALSPIARLPSPVALLAGSIVLVPLALVVSALFFVTVERPCMDPAWWDRLVARFRALRAEGSATPSGQPAELIEVGPDGPTR